MPKPIVLTILDGWGYRPETHGNAIAQARKPIYDKLLRDYPSTLLRASEQFVGLPDGQMGNSEVGHLNLGAGRIVRMDMTRIDTAILDGSLYTDPTLTRAYELAAQKGRALHLIGLLSDGGVHSHQRHLDALIRMAAHRHLPRVFIHASAKPAQARSPPSAVATTPWTATSAGKRKSKPSTRWSPAIPKADAT